MRGAKEIHLRISCPPIRHGCYFGVDFPDTQHLIANGKSVDEIAEFLDVDSLHFLSLQGMLSCVSLPAGQLLHRLLDRQVPDRCGSSG